MKSDDCKIVFFGLEFAGYDFERILMTGLAAGIVLNVFASILAWRDYRREMIDEGSSVSLWEFWKISYTLFPTRPKVIQRTSLIIGLIIWASSGVLWTTYGFGEG